MANLKNSKSQSMGMHKEILTGRTQQVFFNPEEAENYFLKANEINPNNPIITNLLGNVYNNLGNNKLSLDYFLTSNDLLDEEIKNTKYLH